MGSEFYLPLKSDVGIQRDGTKFDSTLHNSGSMVRFYRDRPQKIGGWQLIANGNDEIIRTLYNYDSDGFSYIYIGRPSTLSFLQVFPNLLTSPETFCTPADFDASVQNDWVFDSVTYGSLEAGRVTYVVASCAPNIIDEGDTTEKPVYYGVLGASDAFVPMTYGVDGDDVVTSGGIVVIGPYIVVFGTGGILFWNDGSDFTTWPTGNFFPLGSSKYICAGVVRSGNSASALFWSLEACAIGYIDTSTSENTLLFANVSTRSTLMSSKSVVSLDPCFYWVGNDSFWLYNGSVQELPNTTNKKWFFDNINPYQKSKTFGWVNTKYNEIWFCFCYGDATEPNHAIYYNIDSGKWADTDQINRSAALPSGSVVPYPIMSSSQVVKNGGNSLYPLYAHEIGTDQVQFGVTTPIVAYIESTYYNQWTNSPPGTVLEIDSVIPDIEQTGAMYFYIKSLAYPNSTVQQSDNFDFLNTDQFKTVQIKASIFSITFVSNVIGGNFIMGNTMLHMKVADDQRPGPSS